MFADSTLAEHDKAQATEREGKKPEDHPDPPRTQESPANTDCQDSKNDENQMYLHTTEQRGSGAPDTRLTKNSRTQSGAACTQWFCALFPNVVLLMTRFLRYIMGPSSGVRVFLPLQIHNRVSEKTP